MCCDKVRMDDEGRRCEMMGDESKTGDEGGANQRRNRGGTQSVLSVIPVVDIGKNVEHMLIILKNRQYAMRSLSLLLLIAGRALSVDNN